MDVVRAWIQYSKLHRTTIGMLSFPHQSMQFLYVRNNSYSSLVHILHSRKSLEYIKPFVVIVILDQGDTLAEFDFCKNGISSGQNPSSMDNLVRRRLLLPYQCMPYDQIDHLCQPDPLLEDLIRLAWTIPSGTDTGLEGPKLEMSLRLSRMDQGHCESSV